MRGLMFHFQPEGDIEGRMSALERFAGEIDYQLLWFDGVLPNGGIPCWNSYSTRLHAG